MAAKRLVRSLPFAKGHFMLESMESSFSFIEACPERNEEYCELSLTTYGPAPRHNRSNECKGCLIVRALDS